MSQFAMNNVPSAPPPWPQQPSPQPLAARWPTAIGLVSLIIGIGYLVGTLVQVISLGFFFYTQRMSSFSAMRWYTFGQSAMVVSSIISGVLLVIAAALLLRRKPKARAMHYAYAIVSLSLALVTLAVEVVIPFVGGSFLSLATGMARLLQAYPIFCLIWFSRADVRFDIREMAEPPAET